jgi:hypothetical protein
MLLKELATTFSLYSGKGNFTTEAIDEALNRVVAQSQRVLKHEWQRVKRGEVPYYVTKYTALAVAAIALFGIAYWLWMT